MTNEQIRIIETAGDAAIEQARTEFPHFSDRQLLEWMMKHPHPAFTPDVMEILARDGRADLIRARAHALGVTLQG